MRGNAQCVLGYSIYPIVAIFNINDCYNLIYRNNNNNNNNNNIATQASELHRTMSSVSFVYVFSVLCNNNNNNNWRQPGMQIFIPASINIDPAFQCHFTS